MQNPGEKFTDHGTTDQRQAPERRVALLPTVMAHAYYVVGSRGRCRLWLLTTSCPWCSRPHSHTAKPDAAAFRRTASCHGGRYELLVSTVEGAPAAPSPAELGGAA